MNPLNLSTQYRILDNMSLKRYLTYYTRPEDRERVLAELEKELRSFTQAQQGLGAQHFVTMLRRHANPEPLLSVGQIDVKVTHRTTKVRTISREFILSVDTSVSYSPKITGVFPRQTRFQLQGVA